VIPFSLFPSCPQKKKGNNIQNELTPLTRKIVNIRFFNWSSILQVIVPTVSALSQAQGDESSTLHLTSGSNTYTTGDPERRLRKEKEREGTTCPICLGRPVAGRMTKCGHVSWGYPTGGGIG
jgi:hypothetical protein